MTLQDLKNLVNSKLTRVGANRVEATEVLDAVLEVINFFATQIAAIIPAWTNAQTFQTDGTDAGKYCTYADSNGKQRLFETKVDDNINNAPPIDPNITENAYWKEVSASPGAAIPEWAAGIYGPGLVIVFHNHSVDGRGLYVLLNPTRPFASTDIEDEITAEDWERVETHSYFRGSHDASVDPKPVLGGSGAGGVHRPGDTWVVSVAGVANGEPLNPGSLLINIAPDQFAIIYSTLLV
jgi:hypothetical protein